jgi:hypothetical protein
MGVGSLGAEGLSAANVARPNGYALKTGMRRLVMGGDWPKGGIGHGFAICSARCAPIVEMRKRERPAGGPGEGLGWET